MNVLTLVPARNNRAMRGETEYLDIHIDGVPLRKLFAGRLGALPDAISPLGWQVPGAEAYTFNQFQRFLFASPPDLPDGRNSILVCPLDGDLGCGAYSALFSLDGSRVSWSRFGTENDYDPDLLDLGLYEHLPPLVFDWNQYQAELVRYRAV
jgi:hypothetical protein